MVFFVTLSFCACDNSSKHKQPNIIFILVDDLGWSDLGFMGSDYYETPNIDWLSEQGMVFTNAYAACAVCSPTRASIMTGKYPARLGITDWIRPYYLRGEKTIRPTEYLGDSTRKLLCPPNPYWLEQEELTLAEMLKEEGYTTLHIGKWHLGGQAYHPENQGFDYNIGGCDYGQPPSYFDPYVNKYLPDGIPLLPGRNKGEYLTDRESDEMISFINDHKDKPFYINMCHYAVHTPIEAKGQYIEYFKEKEKCEKQNNARYAAMIKSVDDAMANLIAALEQNELMDNTIIIFFSDNGGHNAFTSNAPLRSGKGNPWEGGIRVPMIFYWKDKVVSGSTCDVPVSSIDFFPTLCKAASVEYSDTLKIDGEDISPLFVESRSIKRNELFWHFPHYRDYEAVTPYSIVRSGQWKLIRFWEGKTELYNLGNDLSEKNNLAGDYPDKVNELNTKLDGWLNRVGAEVPVSNPMY